MMPLIEDGKNVLFKWKCQKCYRCGKPAEMFVTHKQTWTSLRAGTTGLARVTGGLVCKKPESLRGQKLNCLTGQRIRIKITTTTTKKKTMMFSYFFVLAEETTSLISDKLTSIKLVWERKRRGKGKDERASSRPQERNEWKKNKP